MSMFETLLIILLSSLIASAAAAKVPMAMPNCLETCGNFTIPYPFGMGNANCYLNPWFEITCSNTSVPRPFLDKFNLEVLDFGLYSDGKALDTFMIVNHPVYSTCRDGISWNSTDLRGSPFTFSSSSNTFMTVGCENILMTNRRDELLTGCISTCRGERPKSYGCYGINCCQTEISYNDVDFYSLTSTVNASDCTYAFLGFDLHWDHTNLSADSFVSMNWDHVPVTLDWEVQISDFPAGVVDDKDHSAYSCSNQQLVNYKLYTCKCSYYYEGNPYIVNGCRVVPACAKCNGRCDVNVRGMFYCSPNRTTAIIIAGTLGGGTHIVILVVFCFGMYKTIKRRRELKLRKNFFKRNGGLLLQQQLSSNDDSFDTKIFTVKELEKATDNFNISRVLGQGGQGTVYKGMLMDGMIVAVKKSTLVDEGQVEQFINEVVILSQINHRNIVKLLGCCLETEVPLLVYEFISNGTLSQLIRSQEDEFPLSWEMRLQIATEISGALAYLHSQVQYRFIIGTSNPATYY